MIPSQASDWQELDRLIDGACDQSLSADELATLGRWLIEVPEACDRYVACMDVHGRLGWQAMPGKPFSISELAHYTQVDCLSEDESDELSTLVLGNPSLFPFLGNTLHGAVGYFSSGWPVAYLIATVIFGIGLLIGSHVYVSQPVQVARQSSLPSPSGCRAEDGACWQDYGHGRLQVGRGFRVQDSGFRGRKSEIRNQKSEISCRPR